MTTIRARYQRLSARIDQARRDIAALQQECPHTNAEKKHRADTNNYDRSSDRYWTEFTCADCGHRWTEEGSR
jgi:uncharacterized membrane protein YgaE (UPF0421/DUF939 family)